jgi:hypothetical protein
MSGQGVLFHQPRCLCSVLAVAVNYAPTFTAASDPVAVAEDSGLYNKTWAEDISPGVGDSEKLSFSVSCESSPQDLFTGKPAVSDEGWLLFTPAPNAWGRSECNVTLSEVGDSGLSSAPKTLVIVVQSGGRKAALLRHAEPVVRLETHQSTRACACSHGQRTRRCQCSQHPCARVCSVHMRVHYT